jgi:hypothetical protein
LQRHIEFYISFITITNVLPQGRPSAAPLQEVPGGL